MPINSDKPDLWEADVAASVDLYNTWFIGSAPQVFRDARVRTTASVEDAFVHSRDLADITPAVLRAHPDILPTLRMATAPPIARDRLVGLGAIKKNVVMALESGRLPSRMKAPELNRELRSICRTISRLLDRDLLPWLEGGRAPTTQARDRAATIIADRLCGATADPIVRNAQERRQLALIGKFLMRNGYKEKHHAPGVPLSDMEPGTFAFRMNVVVQNERGRRVNIPIDVVIQPKSLRSSRLPVLIEAKSAGDFTNTNKRRKEEATKIRQLKATHGPQVEFLLFLCGYFDSGYLEYEAASGLDWIWEHRIEDLLRLGL